MSEIQEIREVDSLESLLEGAKSLEFRHYSGTRWRFYSSPLANGNDNDNNKTENGYIFNRWLRLSGGVAAFVKTLREANLRHVESVGLVDCHMHPTESLNFNSILAAFTSPITEAKIKSLRTYGVDITTLDVSIISKLTTTMEELAVLAIDSGSIAEATGFWNAISPACLQTLRVTVSEATTADSQHHPGLQNLRRFTSIKTLQFYEDSQPALWSPELLSLLSYLPLVSSLESANLNNHQLISLLSNSRLESLAVKYHPTFCETRTFEDCLEHALAQNTSLKNLSLDFHKCSRFPQAGPMFRGIARNRALKTFDFYPWNCQLDGAHLVEEAITNNKSIERFILRFRRHGWVYLAASALAKNTSIKSVKFMADRFSVIESTNAIPISKFHPKLENLELLMRSFNPSGLACYGADFEEELKQNCGIKRLALHSFERGRVTPYSTPYIERQVQWTREVLNGIYLRSHTSLDSWPGLLSTLDREKPALVYTLLREDPAIVALLVGECSTTTKIEGPAKKRRRDVP